MKGPVQRTVSGDSRSPLWKRDAVIGAVAAIIAALLTYAGTAYSSAYLACDKDRSDTNTRIADSEYAMYFIRVMRFNLGRAIKKQMDGDKNLREPAYEKMFARVRHQAERENSGVLSTLKGASMEEMSRNVDVALRKWVRKWGVLGERTSSDAVSRGFLPPDFLTGYILYRPKTASLADWIDEADEIWSTNGEKVAAYVKFAQENSAGDDGAAFSKPYAAVPLELPENRNLVDASEGELIPSSICRSRAFRAALFLDWLGEHPGD